MVSGRGSGHGLARPLVTIAQAQVGPLNQPRATSVAPRRRQRRQKPRRPQPNQQQPRNTRPGRSTRWQRRWLILGFPVATFATLVFLAPGEPDPAVDSRSEQHQARSPALGSFRYQPNDEVYALDFDPRNVRLGLLEGWDREQDAFADEAALAFVSGPMYERHIDTEGQEITVPLGDLKFGRRVWLGKNRTASRQRAYIGIQGNGQVDFGYGELNQDRMKTYDTFVGGLHSIYNDLEAPPSSYQGAYSVSMGQRIRYYLPRIRMVYGLRRDGRLEMLMSRDGLTLEQTKALARRRDLVAAYMPDHASKSRLIIPGVKGFTEEDANWISGGATSFVHVPYLLRLSKRHQPLQGSLISDLSQQLQDQTQCDGPISCSRWAGHQLMDRALAGLNRVIETGLEPVARAIWSPKRTPLNPDPSSPESLGRSERAPLPEPPITADPLLLLEQHVMPEEILSDDLVPSLPPMDQAPRPDLPPPILLEPESPLAERSMDADLEPGEIPVTETTHPDPPAPPPLDAETSWSVEAPPQLVLPPPPP